VSCTMAWTGKGVLSPVILSLRTSRVYAPDNLFAAKCVLHSELCHLGPLPVVSNEKQSGLGPPLRRVHHQAQGVPTAHSSHPEVRGPRPPGKFTAVKIILQ
jgi:hypothetical protein